MMSLCIAILRFMSGDMLLIDDCSTLLAFVSTTMPMAAGDLYDRNLVSGLASYADCLFIFEIRHDSRGMEEIYLDLLRSYLRWRSSSPVIESRKKFINSVQCTICDLPPRT